MSDIDRIFDKLAAPTHGFDDNWQQFLSTTQTSVKAVTLPELPTTNPEYARLKKLGVIRGIIIFQNGDFFNDYDEDSHQVIPRFVYGPYARKPGIYTQTLQRMVDAVNNDEMDQKDYLNALEQIVHEEFDDSEWQNYTLPRQDNE